MSKLFELKVENKTGQQITLTGNETNYQVTSIDGLNPPQATIQTTTVAGMDGSRFLSSKLGERNIVLLIKINGNIEQNRLYLYRYFKTKQYCKIYYKNGVRSVYAEGYVETIECNLFENGQVMQVSIVCQDPYLKDVDEIISDISNVIGAFTFPFAFGSKGIEPGTTTDDAIQFSYIDKENIVNVVNEGDTASGFIIELTALGHVVNPTVYSVDTNQYFTVNCTLDVGDILVIDTIAGEKSVQLIHNGTPVNYLRFIQRGSSWLQLNLGDNQFAYSAESGSDLMQLLIKFRTRYEGV